MNLPSSGVRWPEFPSNPVLTYRDTALLDLARHAAMRAPFGLDNQQHDTDALWEALKRKAGEMGIEPDGDPAPVLDALETYALTWALDRVAQETASRLRPDA